jgi:hypothetical protein
MNTIIDKTVHERRVSTKYSEIDLVGLIQRDIKERTGFPLSGKTRYNISFATEDRGTHVFETVARVELWNDLTQEGSNDAEGKEQAP